MKLSFSTLGCPRWTFDEVFSTAKDLGLDGVEIRGLADKIIASEIPQFLPQNIEKTKARLAEIKMEIPIITTGAELAVPEKSESGWKEACASIDLAAKLRTPYIRVMGTSRPNVADGDFALAAKLYKKLCDYGEPLKVTPLIETNGRLADSGEMLSFIEKAGGKNCGVLWDIHHPFRFFGEAPETTVKKLGRLIKHVHVKDSVMKNGNVEYRMMGYGDIPVMDSLIALTKLGYDGYISLEWVKRWNPDLQEPGIVFAHFTNYMECLMKQI